MLPTPIVDDKAGPKGASTAVIFPDCLVLTYWDLWGLLAAQQKFGSSLPKLHAFLIEQRINGRGFYSSFRKLECEDLIHLVQDLMSRLEKTATVDEILNSLPERIKKKEQTKAVHNVVELRGSHAPSEVMLQSPGRMLKKEAFRGMWSQLPIDPTSTAEKLFPLFIPKPKLGYFPKGSSFALAKRIDKKVAREVKLGGLLIPANAQSYAVHRAALTLYQEENSWDDSYGVMGEVGQEWIKEILGQTPASLGILPEIFLKDLLMFLVWEDFGLSDSDQVASYLKELSLKEQEIGVQILTDTALRAHAAFQKYRAEEAERILQKLGVQKLSTISIVTSKPHLQLVPSTAKICKFTQSSQS